VSRWEKRKEGAAKKDVKPVREKWGPKSPQQPPPRHVSRPRNTIREGRAPGGGRLNRRWEGGGGTNNFGERDKHISPMKNKTKEEEKKGGQFIRMTMQEKRRDRSLSKKKQH